MEFRAFLIAAQEAEHIPTASKSHAPVILPSEDQIEKYGVVRVAMYRQYT
jgi:hypothetical protein